MASDHDLGPTHHTSFSLHFDNDDDAAVLLVFCCYCLDFRSLFAIFSAINYINHSHRKDKICCTIDAVNCQ